MLTFICFLLSPRKKLKQIRPWAKGSYAFLLYVSLKKWPRTELLRNPKCRSWGTLSPSDSRKGFSPRQLRDIPTRRIPIQRWQAPGMKTHCKQLITTFLSRHQWFSPTLRWGNWLLWTVTRDKFCRMPFILTQREIVKEKKKKKSNTLTKLRYQTE